MLYVCLSLNYRKTSTYIIFHAGLVFLDNLVDNSRSLSTNFMLNIGIILINMLYQNIAGMVQ